MQWLLFLGRFLSLDVAASLLGFPLWWYGDGLSVVIGWSGRTLRYRWRAYALDVWLHNLLVPMYGQTDLFGRAISVAMRIVILIARLVAYGVEAVGQALLLILWVMWPVLASALLALSVYQFLFGASRL